MDEIPRQSAKAARRTDTCKREASNINRSSTLVSSSVRCYSPRAVPDGGTSVYIGVLHRWLGSRYIDSGAVKPRITLYTAVRSVDRSAVVDRKSCARAALFLSALRQTCPLVASPGGRYSHPAWWAGRSVGGWVYRAAMLTVSSSVTWLPSDTHTHARTHDGGCRLSPSLTVGMIWSAHS